MRGTSEQTNLQGLVDQLGSTDSTDRLAGAIGLAARALCLRTQGAARTRRATAVAAAERIPEEAILASARKALTDEHPEIRRSLVFTLGELRSEGTVELLTALAKSDPESSVRAESVDAIAKVGSPQAVRIIQAILESDPSIEVRLRAVRALRTLAGNDQSAREPVVGGSHAR